MRRHIGLLGCGLLAGVVFLSGCPSAKAPGPAKLDCSSEVQYQGVKVQGNTAVLSLASVKGSYESKALRKISDNLGQYIAQQTRLCREYNAGIISGKQYHDETAQLGAHFQPIQQAAKKWDGASPGQRKQLLAKMYDGVATPAQKAKSVAFRLTIPAQLPQGLGGAQLTLRPGEPIPTGASIALQFNTTTDAYVYVFQRKASGEVDVLFPDDRTGVHNPLPGGTVTRIPRQGAYDVDAKDVGLEHMYIVATRTPLTNLAAALDRVRSGKVSKISDDQLLNQFTNVGSESSPGASCAKTRGLTLHTDCVRSRGLVLDSGSGSQANQASLVVQSDLGDDTIVRDFPFDHVMPEQYAAAQAAYKKGANPAQAASGAQPANAAQPTEQTQPAQEGEKSRGIIME